MSETFGRYQLLEKLATGGMGQVYLARQKGPVGFEKLLVVKRVLPHLSEEEDFIDMFFDEARIAALLNHPNIAQIYDLGEVEGTYYLAMEYVHGVSVRDLTARGDTPVPLKCRIIADAAFGLHYAHAAQNAQGEPLGLIHRDVSPQNVLIGFSGGVKVIDFGVAKAAGKISTTMTGTIKGKYAYMSPEQARGHELDHRSDVFGLGIVFWEFLTGERLFKRDTDTATLKAVVACKVQPPSTMAKGIPKGLDAIVAKALAKEPDDRYQTAGDLGFALEELLVQQKLPASSAHLSAFLTRAYPKESQPRIITAAQPAALHVQKLGLAQPPPSSAPPREEPSRSGTARVPPPSAADRSLSLSQSQSRSRGNHDGAALERAMKRISRTDSTTASFFSAVIRGVHEQAGEGAADAIRGTQPMAEGRIQPSQDFFQLLWKAAKVLEPFNGGRDPSFQLLGEWCGLALLLPGNAKGLASASASGDGTATLMALLAASQGALQPGSRRIESATSKSALLAFENDPYPLRFHAGVLSAAFEKLKGVPLQLSWEGEDDEQRLRVRW